MILKVGMQHLVLEYYQICSNDDPGMTLTYFMARSNLVPYAQVSDTGPVVRWLLLSCVGSYVKGLLQMV